MGVGVGVRGVGAGVEKKSEMGWPGVLEELYTSHTHRHGVLRPGHRQPIAGHNDHPSGRKQSRRGAVYVNLSGGALDFLRL